MTPASSSPDLEAIASSLDLAGRYRLESCIAEGGMGTVFRAEQISLGRPVALKVLKGYAALDADGRRRFVAEARLAARVTHPCVVRVIEPGEGPGGLYIVYELVEGRSLRELMDGGALAPRVLSWLVQAATGLQAIHEAGAVHRDVKPENMLVDASGGLKLTDLGIAKDLATREQTRAGILVGTPAYMSPEQCRGEPVGPASDVYSLGVLLYEVLAGTLPFISGDPREVLRAHVHEAPEPPSRRNRHLDAAWDVLVLRALEKDPRSRVPSAAELARELQRVSELAPVRRPPRTRPAPAVVTAVKAAAPAGATIRREGSSSRPDPVVQRTRGIPASAHAGGRPKPRGLEPATRRLALALAVLAGLGAAAGLGWRARMGPAASDRPAAASRSERAAQEPPPGGEPGLASGTAAAPVPPRAATLDEQFDAAIGRLRALFAEERRLLADVSQHPDAAPLRGRQTLLAELLLIDLAPIRRATLSLEIPGWNTPSEISPPRIAVEASLGTTNAAALALQPGGGVGRWSAELPREWLQTGWNMLRVDAPASPPERSSGVSVWLEVERAPDFPETTLERARGLGRRDCSDGGLAVRALNEDYLVGKLDRAFLGAKRHVAEHPECPDGYRHRCQVILRVLEERIRLNRIPMGSGFLSFFVGDSELDSAAESTLLLEAVRLFNEAAAIAPGWGTLFRHQGEWMVRIGRPRMGLRSCRWAVLVDPADHHACWKLADLTNEVLLSRRPPTDESVAMAEDLIAILRHALAPLRSKADRQDLAMLALGNVLLHAGRESEAESALRESLENNPQLSEAARLLGQIERRRSGNGR